VDRETTPGRARSSVAGLIVLLSLAAAAAPSLAQQRRVYFALQGGAGDDWTAAGAQLELATAERWRVAADALIGEGVALAASAFWGLSRSDPQRVAPYLGAGVGVVGADSTSLALHVRAGGELPLTPRRLAVRLELREYLIDGDGRFVLVGMVRWP
jgi:hypothetical protein